MAYKKCVLLFLNCLKWQCPIQLSASHYKGYPPHRCFSSLVLVYFRVQYQVMQNSVLLVFIILIFPKTILTCKNKQKKTTTTTPLPISCKCGVPSSNDLIPKGGRPVETNEFPWLVALVRTGRQAFCAGTLISTRTVLTAGHCLILYKSSSKSFDVHIGEHNLTSQDTGEQKFQAFQIEIHPVFNYSKLIEPSKKCREILKKSFLKFCCHSLYQ